MSCEGSALLCEDALFSKTLIFVIDKLIGNAICFVLREGVKSLLSSTSHEVVQYDSSSPCDGVVAWFKDYNNGDYHLLRVNVTSQSQQHFLSVSPIVGEERWSEYPTALTFILDARGESATAMLNTILPPSPWFLIMPKKWWEDLLSSFPNVAPLGKSEDWESTRKSYVAEVVRAISSCSDVNEGFIALVIKIASVVADTRHQASWMIEQLHWQHEAFCVINADSTSTQLDDTGAMTGHGQLASVPRNVTAMKSTMSRKEPLAPTDVTPNYLLQVNNFELCGTPPVNDIRNESMLQCPPPPSESNSLTESTGSPERPLSRKGGVDKEDQCEDVPADHMLALPCTEENPQSDELVENEDSHTFYLQSFMEFLGTPHTGSLITGVDADEENQDPLSIECSEEQPANDELVENPDSRVPIASRGPAFIRADKKE